MLLKLLELLPCVLIVNNNHVPRCMIFYSLPIALTSLTGVWKLDYNKIAARALLRVISQKNIAIQISSKLLKHRKQKSALFLSQLPTLVDVEFVEKIKTAGPLSIRKNQDDQQLNLIMDRMLMRDAVIT